MIKRYFLLFCIFLAYTIQAQDYYFSKYAPFDTAIPTPEQFLGYPIGEQHTRHDQIVNYLTKLAELSDKATIAQYGATHENRKLVMLTVSSEQNLGKLASIKKQHLAFSDTQQSASNYNDVPVFINLGYNVHGNEPSSSEAALLTAYTLVASQHPEIENYRNNSVIFLDPTINPDGRDRHTQWANSFKGSPLVSDNIDAEHTEMWPGGRTNHYWFDLNRDWLLAINPESRGKLDWYHEWYPNVVTDFHEMGTNSTHFFEPMLPIGSLDPIMPKENYEDLNNLFAPYFSSALDEIGSFYFTKEAFDGTYPGYGSSYPDLQGALALLFEQASSRGHLQDTDYGTISFPFTIRNQYTSGMATIKASVENKATLRKYQQDFFKSAFAKAKTDQATAYEFGDPYDKNRTKAFIDKLQKHRIEVYKKKGDGKYVVPVLQPQKRMVQSFFETYEKYRDSVYYDASAWSVGNFYNMRYKSTNNVPNKSNKITSLDDIAKLPALTKTNYAYLIDYDDYNATALMHELQEKGIGLSTAFKPFTAQTSTGRRDFNYGTLLIPVSRQENLNAQEVYDIVVATQKKFEVPIYSTNTGFSLKGIDLGSRNFRKVTSPKALMVIGNGVRSYEAGEVWHLLDTRVHMPITKVLSTNFNRVNLNDYNTLVMVSGNYNSFSENRIKQLKDWISQGNTLITIGTATSWAVTKEIVKEKLTKSKEDTTDVQRKNYVDARPNRGKQRLGGAIFKVDVDLTHPLGFGYRYSDLPVYKNNNVWLAPSKNEYNTVAKYSVDPHIDGFISDENLENNLKPSASLVVSKVGRGRVVLFADNPNFRGSWYGTNKLFFNALFFGNLID